MFCFYLVLGVATVRNTNVFLQQFILHTTSCPTVPHHTSAAICIVATFCRHLRTECVGICFPKKCRVWVFKNTFFPLSGGHAGNTFHIESARLNLTAWIGLQWCVFLVSVGDLTLINLIICSGLCCFGGVLRMFLVSRHVAVHLFVLSFANDLNHARFPSDTLCQQKGAFPSIVSVPRL